MNKSELLVIAAAAAAVWLIVKKLPFAAAKTPAGAGQIANGALPGQPGWGWDYFEGGVAIDPDGTYYLNGSKVWSPS